MARTIATAAAPEEGGGGSCDYTDKGGGGWQGKQYIYGQYNMCDK